MKMDMAAYQATDLSLALDMPVYTWGPILRVHHIGRYAIVEYTPNEALGTCQFHPFIDGSDTNRGYDTLEAAIVGAIAYRFDGVNSHARNVIATH